MASKKKKNKIDLNKSFRGRGYLKQQTKGGKGTSFYTPSMRQKLKREKDNE